MNNIFEYYINLDYQRPNNTEEFGKFIHSLDHCDSDNIYLAVPWASIIDFIDNNIKPKSGCDYLEDKSANEFIQEIFQNFDKNTSKEFHTICQHVYWKKLISVWEFLGIQNVYASHLEKKFFHEKIKFHPWHLVASNIENPKRNKFLKIKPNEEKKFLLNFIGCHTDKHSSSGRNFRKKIEQIFDDRCKIIFRNKSWFFEELVFKKEKLSENLEKIKTETLEYNQTISDSVFTLCPHGSGPNSIRLWESMSIGSIPVLFETNWERPTIEEYEWNQFSITLKQADVVNVVEILQNITEEKIEEMKINCINAYNIFRTKTCF